MLNGSLCLFGGYFGAALADFFQGSIMIGGVCLLVYFVAAKGVSLTGSVPKALSQAAAYTPGSNGWDLVWLVLLTSLGALGMPHMIHKFYAIKDEGYPQGNLYFHDICTAHWLRRMLLRRYGPPRYLRAGSAGSQCQYHDNDADGHFHRTRDFDGHCAGTVALCQYVHTVGIGVVR